MRFSVNTWPVCKTTNYHLNYNIHVFRWYNSNLTLSQTRPGFYVCLLKTLWEKEKLLIMSNFSFTHNVFDSFEELSAIFIKFEIVVCKLFQF